jgi:hypothetical protein
MLATRGPVYDKTTVTKNKTGARYHAACSCTAEEVFGDWQPTAREQAYIDAYHAAGSGLSAVSAMRAQDTAGLFRDGAKHAKGFFPRTNKTAPRREDLADRVAKMFPDAKLTGFDTIADHALAAAQITRLEELARKYPVALEEVAFADPPAGKNWIAWVEDMKLSINRGGFGQTQMDRGAATGWFHAAAGTDPARYIMTHEWGHVMHNAAGRETVRARADTALRQALVEHEIQRRGEVTPDVRQSLAEVINTMSDGQVRGVAHEYGLVSGYAGAKEGSTWEVVAEAFATIEASPTTMATDLENTIYAILIEEYRKGATP